MIINNIDISTLGAKLISHTLSPIDITANYFTPVNSLPTFYSKDITTHNLTVKLWVKGISRETTENYINQLNDLISNKTTMYINDTNDIYFYDCIYKNVSSYEFINTNNRYITFELIATKKSALVTTTITSTNNTVNNIGLFSCNYIIEITNNGDTKVTDYKINDITIDNISAGKTFIIDGVQKTITEDNVNKFNLTNVTKFPVLDKGNNTFTIATDSTDITTVIKYNPIY